MMNKATFDATYNKRGYTYTLTSPTLNAKALSQLRWRPIVARKIREARKLIEESSAMVRGKVGSVTIELALPPVRIVVAEKP